MATAPFGNSTITSAFQPIFSFSHRRVVGFEGLVRGRDSSGNPLSPADIFGSISTPNETLYLDRICRHLHVCNMQRLEDVEKTWLFININPHVILDGKRTGSFFTPTLLERTGFPANRLVIEILEKEIQDEGLMEEAVTHYREMGCLVAIDDFGAGASNFDRIWKFKPDIVKLDRSLIVNAENNTRARRILPSLVSLLHEAACLVLLEGVETEDQALMTMDADVDMVQGFHFARPQSLPERVHTGPPPGIDSLAGRLREDTEKSSRKQFADLSRYLGDFWESAHSACVDGTTCDEFLSNPRVRRCFALDDLGGQTERNMVAEEQIADSDPRFEPIKDARGADWSRRAYFRRALSRPGEVQVTGPYLSLPDATMCVTLSLALKVGESTRVFCCDLDWEEGGQTSLITGSMGPWPRNA
ncbi:MAG: EAL domain-containing protein [Magnetococcales bacterium]|nr:EAL domain-containing protein [Magnetococcales bacterium]